MTTLFEVGDSVKGDLVLAQARKIKRPQVIVATGRHKAQRVILEENVFCVIRKKTRFHPQLI
ncbi:MAG: hypothetical protein NUV67_06040 [archaeon]|nr:hypothetical protein [archaeon]